MRRRRGAREKGSPRICCRWARGAKALQDHCHILQLTGQRRLSSVVDDTKRLWSPYPLSHTQLAVLHDEFGHLCHNRIVSMLHMRPAG